MPFYMEAKDKKELRRKMDVRYPVEIKVGEGYFLGSNMDCFNQWLENTRELRKMTPEEFEAERSRLTALRARFTAFTIWDNCKEALESYFSEEDGDVKK
jgi:hypothetical protein